MYDRRGLGSEQGSGTGRSASAAIPGKRTLTSQLPPELDAPVAAKSDAGSEGAAVEPAASTPAEHEPASQGAPGATPEAAGPASATAAKPAAGATAEGLSGSIGVITGPGLAKSAGDSDEIAQDRADPVSGGIPVELSMTTTTSMGPGIGAGASKYDTGDVTAGTTFSQPGGRSVSPFGAEFYEPAFSSTTWVFSGGVCKITTTLDINCPWGTASGGRTDIPSATDPAITKTTWEKVRDDLTPSTASPHKSPRSKFYSQALVERHEKFHGTDDEGWTKSSGIPLVQAKATGATISSGTASADVTKLLTDSLSMLRSENLKWYKGGGSSHDSYAGEIRAYADGKPEYETLAKAVEAHGKTLP